MHTGGRPDPHSPHVLSFRNAAVSVACGSVRWIRFTALTALSRVKKSTPAAATKTVPSHRTEVVAWRFSGMAMLRLTVRVTVFHARRWSATIRSVSTAASTTSSVYMRAVLCMRASSTPRCSLRA
eukprot:6212821-Pleurochrysis_carterae.AAC.2